MCLVMRMRLSLSLSACDGLGDENRAERRFLGDRCTGSLPILSATLSEYVLDPGAISVDVDFISSPSADCDPRL